MICRCLGKTLDLNLVRQTALSMLGVPDYERYADHVAATHPDRAALTRDEFFRARQLARFGTTLRCC